MCTLTIDCRCETCIDGITRYQWPRIIAVQAPPSSSAELRKLTTVSADDRRRAAGGHRRAPAARSRPGRRPPPPRGSPVRDRREHPADRRPVEDDRRARQQRDAATRRRDRVDRRPRVAWKRNASATTSRIAASPALKRKNFTPASRETNTSVKTMPTPRWARKRKRTRGQVGRRVEAGSADHLPASCHRLLAASRLLISAQFTTFHQASR